jgi:hypothetical protein
MGKIVDFDPRKRRKWKARRDAPAQPRPYVRKRPAPRQHIWIPGIAIVAAMAFFAISDFVSPFPGCNIKGNISINSGERIYHVPGQEYYSQTRITFLKGERWFCSEEAAREAGWRKAYR